MLHTILRAHYIYGANCVMSVQDAADIQSSADMDHNLRVQETSSKSVVNPAVKTAADCGKEHGQNSMTW